MKVLSVNRGSARKVTCEGRTVLTAIGKQPVQGPVAVGRLGLEGDEVADPTRHGGLSKAVYAYPHEHYAFWQTVRAQARVQLWDEPMPHGLLGENLTLSGITEDKLFIGDRLLIGGRPGAPGCVLAVSEPRFPCAKLGVAMGFAQAVKLMAQSGYCGSYLGVLLEGQVQAGDAIVLEPGPREVNLRELFRARVSG